MIRDNYRRVCEVVFSIHLAVSVVALAVLVGSQLASGTAEKILKVFLFYSVPPFFFLGLSAAAVLSLTQWRDLRLMIPSTLGLLMMAAALAPVVPPVLANLCIAAYLLGALFLSLEWFLHRRRTYLIAPERGHPDARRPPPR